jgi:uncharacterized protein (DUF302 family)
MTSEPSIDPPSEHVVQVPLDRVIDLLTRAIEAAGLQVFFTMDHDAAARSVGMSMQPTRVIFYGNPRGGTPIMEAHPRSALDLPLRVLVRASGPATTTLSFHPVVDLLAAAGVPREVAARLDPAQRLLIDALQDH